MHAIPTLCDADGNGLWESGAVLRHLVSSHASVRAHTNACCLAGGAAGGRWNRIGCEQARLAGEPETDKTNMALDWRQTTAYQFFAKIYAPHLGFGGDAATIPEGVKGMKEKVEPIVKHFLGDGKFIGGAAPCIADYSLVPCLTLLVGSAYWAEADPAIKAYVADFQGAVPSFAEIGKVQT